MGKANVYNDEWIVGNYLNYPSYKEMVADYNRIFGTDLKLIAFKNHAHYKLKLKKPRVLNPRYTEEQIKWLKENYPKYGCEKTMTLFNDKFNETRTFHSMKNFGQLYGVKVDENVAINNKLSKVRATGSKRALRKVGDIREECGRPIMKTADGKWKAAGRVVYEQHYGKVSKDYTVIHLDNDCHNYELSNLVAIPLSYSGLLLKNNFKSENAEITKTAIKWCELYEAVNKEVIR